MNSIEIPPTTWETLNRHLFQDDLEQGAFLFAHETDGADGVRLVVFDHYLVPRTGWERQLDIYLQMRDEERAKIMRLARDKKACAIDCHSHPGAGRDVWFSPSDIHGITEFAPYAKWKLSDRPFAAIVWGEDSLDAVMWSGDFKVPQPVHEVFSSDRARILQPTRSWFAPYRGKHRFNNYE